MNKKIILPAFIGNALEYYDFTLFAVFSAEIAKVFFPNQEDFSQILLSLAVFAVGFLMRPLGAIIFGHIGDKLGRKKALTISMACMAIPTFMMGILPGYETLGSFAPMFLISLRLIQGISIGGEGAGSAIFVLEHNQGLKLGYLGGMITASNFIGAFCATLVGLGISYFGLSIISWRYAFILGGFLGLVSFYLRLQTRETPIFEEVERRGEIVKLPLLVALTINKREMLLSGFLGGLVGAVAYMILAYINIFFNKIVGLSPSLSLLYAAIGIGSYIACLPFSGMLSDKVGYLRSTLQACCYTAVLIIPLFIIMGINHPVLSIIMIALLGALGAWICAPAYPIMLSIFPAKQRYSGIAFSFNLGIALFGGTAPIISAYLTKLTGRFSIF